MNINKNNTIYIFSPHPDDETLACGGTIIKRLSEGYNVKIIVMTDGSKSHSASFNLYSDPTPYELAQLRRQETINAVTILGVLTENIIFLNGEDGNLLRDKESMLEQIKILLKNDTTNITEIFLTHKNDYHSDHIATNKIVLDVIEELKIKSKLLYYKIYPTNGQVVNSEFIETHIDILDVLPIKVNAIKQYKSQTTILYKNQHRPVISSSLLNKFCSSDIEIFWHN